MGVIRYAFGNIRAKWQHLFQSSVPLPKPFQLVDVVKVFDPRYPDCVQFSVKFDHCMVKVKTPFLRAPFDIFIAPAEAKIQAKIAQGASLRKYPKDTIRNYHNSSDTLGYKVSFHGVEVTHTSSQGERMCYIYGSPSDDSFEWHFDARPKHVGFLAGNERLYLGLNNPQRPPHATAELKVKPILRYTILDRDKSVPPGPGWPLIRVAVIKQMQEATVNPTPLIYSLAP